MAHMLLLFVACVLVIDALVGDKGLLAMIQARKEYSQRRDRRRVVPQGPDQDRLVAPGGGPSGEVAARDLLEEVRRRLSPEEQQILELRNQGDDWAAIAAQLGGGAEALRKKLARAIDRVAEQLGLDDEP